MEPGKEPWFLKFQRRWVDDDSQIKFWEKSRRIGATYCQAWEDVRDLVENEDTGRLSQPSVWFSSADESAAREYIRYCAHWAGLLNLAAEERGKQVLDEGKDVKALVLEIPGCGRIHALSSNPSRFRSKGGKAVVDEFAWHSDQERMWDAVEPLTTWGDPLRIISTHNGKRLFHRFCREAKAGRRPGAVHSTTLPEATEQGLLDKIKGRATTEEEREAFIQERHAQCRDEEQWLQEYLCTPVDAADAFLTYDMLAACEDGGVLWKGGLSGNASADSDLYLGFDVGRRNDLSVIWLVERIGPMLFTRDVRIMEKTPFRAQRDVLYSSLEHPGLRRACIDATGLGMQLAEEAQRRFGAHRVEQVNFTNSWKEEAAYELRRRIEEKTLVLPESQTTREDLHSIKKTTTPAGNLRFDVAGSASTDGHADRFWAAALACHAVSEYSGPVHVASRSPDVAPGLSGMQSFGGAPGRSDLASF
jgi:phage FluMu gp28-like protein